MRIKDILKILCSSLLLLSFTGCSSDDDPDMPLPADDITTDGMVIYEANPALFGETQALNGLTAQLPRIKKLEANVLWLMPIFQQGEKNAVGSPYCVKDYRAINPAYGTLSDLKALVTKAHAEGMLVILDWVANHTAWDHAWTTEHKDWYTHLWVPWGHGEFSAPCGCGSGPLYVPPWAAPAWRPRGGSFLFHCLR